MGTGAMRNLIPVQIGVLIVEGMMGIGVAFSAVAATSGMVSTVPASRFDTAVRYL